MLQSSEDFLGFVQYLAKSLTNLSDVIEPLRKLTKQDMKWKWSDKESKAFNKAKEMLAKEPGITTQRSN